MSKKSTTLRKNRRRCFPLPSRRKSQKEPPCQIPSYSPLLMVLPRQYFSWDNNEKGGGGSESLQAAFFNAGLRAYLWLPLLPAPNYRRSRFSSQCMCYISRYIQISNPHLTNRNTSSHSIKARFRDCFNNLPLGCANEVVGKHSSVSRLFLLVQSANCSVVPGGQELIALLCAGRYTLAR